MIDRNEVDQMAKFMAAIQPDSVRGPSSETGSPRATAVDTSAVAEMKLVLERFHAAADHVVTEAPDDRELREALMTEVTERGARIGSWEIRVHAAGQHKLYDVVNVLNGESLAADLLLYEAARGLVRILNEGGRINANDAIELLRAEQEYNSRVQDMVLYKHRMTHNPRSSRLAVFEDRYTDARRRAVLARERVMRLSERR
jgi:hypothetical protein